jgi:5-methylcytosine-specific restriction protein A
MYSKLTSRSAVLKAIKEFDQLGQAKFLAKYRFGVARNYYLVYRGNQYDSKAILGVAHKYQFGNPLSPSDFSGGKHTVRPKLEKMGFKVITMKVDQMTSSIPEEVSGTLWEGARQEVSVNRFERNPNAKLACIDHHGYGCAVCSFDFGSTYGDEFVGFIHVHQTKPLSKIKKRYRVHPVNDLVPVCANCHAIIHFGGKTRSVEQVRKLFISGRNR